MNEQIKHAEYRLAMEILRKYGGFPGDQNETLSKLLLLIDEQTMDRALADFAGEKAEAKRFWGLSPEEQRLEVDSLEAHT